jgi:outer membrane lipoprotein-sorting protein
MQIKHTFLSVLCALLVLAGSALTTAAQTPTGRAVMKAYKAQDRTEDTEAVMKISIINSRGNTRERELTLWTKTQGDDTRMQLIRFEAPADVRGTGFLSIENAGREDDHWLYLPALRKTRRIAGSDKQDRFVGTDFSFEDLESEKLDAYRYERIGEETLGGTATWIIEAVPTDPDKIEETAYVRRELWVSKDRALLLQAKLYDKEGTYVKRLTASDMRQVPGSKKWRPYRLVMEDVQKGDKTVLEIVGYKIDQGVPADYFSQRYLKRGR